MENTIKIRSFDEVIQNFEALQDNTRIELQNDTQLTASVKWQKSCVIDLGGFVLNMGEFSISVIKGVNLEFTNGTIEYSSTAFSTIGTISAPCSLKFSRSINIEGSGKLADVQKQSKLILDGTKVTSSASTTLLAANGKEATIQLTSSSITHDGVLPVIQISNGGRIVLDASTSIKDNSEESESSVVVLKDTGSSGFMTGNACVESTCNSLITVLDGAGFSVESGKLTTNSSYHSVKVFGQDAAFRLIGGEVSNTVGDGVQVGSGCQLDIVGGTITSAKYAVSTSEDSQSYVECNLLGGRFYGQVDPIYIPNGKAIIDGLVVDAPPELEPIPDPIPEPTIEPTPDPEPDPAPQPDPTPVPDPGEGTEEKLPSTIHISKMIWIYRSPSTKLPSTEFVGVLTIVKDGFEDRKGIKFVKVSFKVPGSGAKASGYAKRDALLPRKGAVK